MKKEVEPRIVKQIDAESIKAFRTVGIRFDYLKTAATVYGNPFTALVELIDNSKDADAKNVWIDFVHRDDMDTLEILDDGLGMSREEVDNIIAFGYSDKASNNEKFIGRYGIGLKAGSARLGTELLILTKKDGVYTALLISRKFHKGLNNYDNIFVPIPSFDENFEPVGEDRELHDAEVEVIELFGPLGSLKLRDLFEKIKGPSGTLIIIDKLRRNMMGELELNVTATEDDITLEDRRLEEWNCSLRKFLSIMYWDLKMNIIIRGRPLVPVFLPEFWMFRRTSKTDNWQFRGNQDKEIEALDKEVARLNDLRNVTKIKVELATSGNAAENYQQARSSLKLAKEAQREEKKKKNVEVEFNFGVNVRERHNYGIYFYLNDRLIIGAFKDTNLFRDKNVGICLYIRLSYHTFLPTNAKQKFDNTVNFQKLLSYCENATLHYLSFLEEDAIPRMLVTDFGDQSAIKAAKNYETDTIWQGFWTKFGYEKAFKTTCRQKILEPKVERIITRECMVWRRCKRSHHWRCFHSLRLPLSPSGFECPEPKCPDTSRNCNWEPLCSPESLNNVKFRKNLKNEMPEEEWGSGQKLLNVDIETVTLSSDEDEDVPVEIMNINSNLVSKSPEAESHVVNSELPDSEDVPMPDDFDNDVEKLMTFLKIARIPGISFPFDLEHSEDQLLRIEEQIDNQQNTDEEIINDNEENDDDDDIIFDAQIFFDVKPVIDSKNHPDLVDMRRRIRR